MTTRNGGFRRKTRALLRKHARVRGKIKLSRYFAKFEVGDRVLLLAEPAIQSGMYHPRFHAKLGKVQRQKGSCYDVEIFDGKKPKLMSIHPVHLRKE